MMLSRILKRAPGIEAGPSRTQVAAVIAVLSIWWVSAQADNPGCTISFDTARLDVCTERLSLAHDGLAHLGDIETFAGAEIRVVKFDRPVGATQRAALEALEIEILGYVPYHAYLVRMPQPEATAAAVRAIEGVVWAGPYLPVWKIGINLANELADGRILARAEPVDGLRVTLHRNGLDSRTRAAFAVLPGVEVRFGGQSAEREFLVLDFERAALAAVVDELAASDDVLAIDFHWPAGFMNSQAGWLHQSGQNDPPRRPVFDQGIFGCGQTIGVFDSGLHTPHCSFDDTAADFPHDDCNQGAGCEALEAGEAHRKIAAYYKWSGLPGGPGDPQGHGTFVVGNALGNNHADAVDCDNLSTPGGLTDLDGSAPGARVVMQEVGANFEYLGFGGTLYHAAAMAYESGARIHNNSWRGSCAGCGCEVVYDTHSRDADTIVWEHPDLLVFAAAGNFGATCVGTNVTSPANAKNVFAIGSNQRGVLGNSMSGFSSRGPASDGRTKPELTAQGGDVVSAQRDACGTRTSGGTSFASPAAAGLGALVREYLQRGFYPLGIENPAAAIPSPSAALIKAIMINGAVPISGQGTGGEVPNQHQGWGRILLDNALYFDGDPRQLWLHDETAGLQTGEEDFHALAAGGEAPLVVTLTWHDFPAELNANPHIVNRLRLEVETPDGAVWTQKLPPGGDLGNTDPFQDITAENYDHLNTVHQIVLDPPAAGIYGIRVSGIEVAMGGRQPYALAATGDFGGLSAEPAAAEVCAADGEFESTLSLSPRFDGTTELVASGLPPGTDSAFDPNPVQFPDDHSVFTLAGLEHVAGGDYFLELTATDADDPDNMAMIVSHLTVQATAPASPVLTAPAADVFNVPLRPTFRWQASGGMEYHLEVATDPAFDDIVYQATTRAVEHTADEVLPGNIRLFWRVLAGNACGDALSGTETFITEGQPGECPFGYHTPVHFHDDLSAGVAGWTHTGPGNSWALQDEHTHVASHAWHARSPSSVSDQQLITPPVELPSGHFGYTLQFHTRYALEGAASGCFDGALLEVSTDDGEHWTPVPADALLANAYDHPIHAGFGNPAEGLDGWCGNVEEWTGTVVSIDELAGETVRFRFRLATNKSVGGPGWWVDDVSVHSCVQPAVEDLIYRDRFEPNDE